MNAQTISLPASTVKAIALFAAKNDLRAFLNGILLEQNGGTVRLTATNGHVLATTTIDTAPGEGQKVLIPNAALDIAFKADKNTLTLRIENDTYTLNTIPFSPLEGRYPDVTRIWPKTLDNTKPCNVNPEYFALLGKAAKIQKSGLFDTKQGYADGKMLVFEVGCLRGVIMGIHKGMLDTVPAY